MPDKEKAGHRQRLRERFLAGETGSCSDEALLELLLTFAIGRKDVKSLAHELIRVFGSLSQVLSASPNELYKVKGVGQSSVAMLKAVNLIRSSKVSTETRKPIPKEAGVAQQKLFENSTDGQPGPDSESSKPHEAEKPSVSYNQPENECEISTGSSVADMVRNPRSPSQPSIRISSAGKNTQRKLQVSNGHYLNFDHLARLMNAISDSEKNIGLKMSDIEEETGLPFRQVRNRVSIGRALALIERKKLQLTTLGNLILEHDPFCESIATLEFLHFVAAGNFENLVWFDTFNTILPQAKIISYSLCMEYFQAVLANRYSEKSLKDHLGKEVRFIFDAYLNQNFQKLSLLQEDSSKNIYQRRYTGFAPLVLSAMIYDFCASREAHLSQVGEMAVTPGSPAVVFGLDAASFRQQIEGLHDRGWLRYETTHNLDQIRLKPGFSALSFLTAHFENHEPREETEPSHGGIFQ